MQVASPTDHRWEGQHELETNRAGGFDATLGTERNTASTTKGLLAPNAWLDVSARRIRDHPGEEDFAAVMRSSRPPRPPLTRKADDDFAPRVRESNVTIRDIRRRDGYRKKVE